MNRALIVASVCFVVGACIGYAVHCSLGPKDDPNTVDVEVTTHYLQPEVPIREQDVRVAKFPASLAPSGALYKTWQAVGRVALYPIAQGEVVLPNKIGVH